MTRQFYKTVITVTVISDYTFDFDNLAQVHYDITDGACSGTWDTQTDLISPEQAAEELVKQGSDPSFMELDDELTDGVIVCPRCKQTVHIDDETVIADHGMCQDCLNAWKHGDLKEGDNGQE